MTSALIQRLPLLQQLMAQQASTHAFAASMQAASREARVDDALRILELEAGLSETTMATLRQAVKMGMERKAIHEHNQQELVAAASVCGVRQQLSPQNASMLNSCAHHPSQDNRTPRPAASSTPALRPSIQANMPRPVKPSSSKRQQLTVEEAAEIYSLRPRRSDASCGARGVIHCRCVPPLCFSDGGRTSSGRVLPCPCPERVVTLLLMPGRNLAPHYGVTPKTIRDVWSGRTWAEATRHLWTKEEIAARETDKVAKRKHERDEDSSSSTETEISDHIHITTKKVKVEVRGTPSAAISALIDTENGMSKETSHLSS